MNLIIISITFLLSGLVSCVPLSFNDEILLEDLLRRDSRSLDRNEVNLEWPQKNEIRDEQYAPNDIDTFLKNEFNKFRKKKLLPLEMYKRRLENKERIDKRNSPNNANYYMQLCHFKICNMGKRRSSRFLQ